MKLRKLAIFTMAVLLCFALVGCKKKNKDKTTSYEIVYNLDGGKISGEYATTYTSKDGLAQLPKPTKEGFDFSGWYDADGKRALNIAVGETGKKEFTAKWTKVVFTITYDLDGGTLAAGAPTTFNAALGTNLSAATKEGATFMGWSTEDGKVINKIDANQFTKDITLKAVWASGNQIKLSFNLDGGNWPEGVVAPTTFSEEAGLKLDTLPTPVKEGKWEFKGWTIDGKAVTEIAAGTSEPVTLVAVWDLPSSEVTYKITYVCEGGSLPEGIQHTYVFGQGYVLPDATPTKPTDKFLGWYDAQGNKVTTITANDAGDKVLTAKFGIPQKYVPRWEPNVIGFSGAGMEFGIMVNPVTEYDPYNPNYTGTNTEIKQNHQSEIESAYDITIKWKNYDDSAPWGPERVKFINTKYLANEFGSTYVVNITSQWIPTLVKGGSIAELYDMNTGNGIFNNLSYDEESDQLEPGYLQDSTINDATSVKGKVYGYGPGAARPDYFMYYNVDLVQKCSLEDPAELWLKGQWTLSKFDEWVKLAQNTLKNEGGFALDMGFAESVIGMVASTGNQMTKVKPPLVNITRQEVTDTIALLQSYYSQKVYYGRGVQDVSPGFKSGITLLHHGDIWFLKNSDRFDPSVMQFKVGVVPYPTADGEGGIPQFTTDVSEAVKNANGDPIMLDGKMISTVDMSASSFKIPYTGTACYSVLNINGETSANGINPEIITHILHDLTSGLGDDPNNKVTMTPEESYEAFLETKFDREIDVAVVMSCQGQTYFELMELLSMTVGGGSHFGDNAWWPLAASIIKSSDSPATRLNAVLNNYKEAMRDLGYNVK